MAVASPLPTHDRPGAHPQAGPVVLVRFRLTWPGFALEVEQCLPGRGVTAFFGPSGSGKTTLLRCIAGLETAGEGWLDFQGEVWQDSTRRRFVPTHRRPLGYVFQEASLFPHVSVRGNIEYGHQRARRRDWLAWPWHLPGPLPRGEPSDPAAGLGAIIDLLGIGALLDRMPDRLSGGERQRVAIARALAAQPRLLLMDEPLAALDPQRKAEILPYLERLHDELAIPVFYVSHSPEEVARLADHILVFEQGRIRAAGPAPEILARLDLPLARDSEASSFLDGRVLAWDADYDLMRVQVPGAHLWVPGASRPVGARVRVRIQARDVSLSPGEPAPSSILNVFPARILEFGVSEGPRLLVKLGLEDHGRAGNLDGPNLLARITRQSRDRLGLTLGQRVHAQVKAVALME